MWGGENQAESSVGGLAQESTGQTDREGVPWVGVILVLWVSARATRKLGSDSERRTVPNLPRPPFPQLLLRTVFHPKGLCPSRKGQERKEQTGGEAPGGLQFPSSLHPSLWAPPFLVLPSVWPTIPLNSLLTPLPAPTPASGALLIHPSGF